MLHTMKPETLYVADDGSVPNNRLPFLLYRQVHAGAMISASALEALFSANGWSGSWRNGVFPFHHYHSTSHEVLGVYAGNAVIQLGGASGPQVEVSQGDVIVIPAGGGHRRIRASDDFGVVGAYPGGRSYDMCYGEQDERPGTDRRIAAVPLPVTDPVYGGAGPLCRIWKDAGR